MKMDAMEFIEFADYIIEKEMEDGLREQWNLMLPFMSLKMLKYMPFNEYVDKCTGRNIDRRPNDVIIAEILEAHSQWKGDTDGNI